MKVYKSLPLLLVACFTVSCGSKSVDSLNVGQREVTKEAEEVLVNGIQNPIRHTDIQLAYLNSEDYSDTTPYNGNMSVSAPKPVVLSWKRNGWKSVLLNIYKDKELKNLDVSYHVMGDSFDFYNTEVGQTYYVTVQGGTEESEPVSFTIGEKGPRNLFIEGVENVRDLGGWGKIKQGMIYRSGRFNEDKEETPKASIGENGLIEMNDHLKIKTEIDLRRTSTNEVGGLTNKSVLGDSVKYIQLPMYYGGNNILTFKGKASKDDYDYDNPAKIKEFFEILAVKDNYPIDFHCSIGKDRTGCLAYLVEALLGFDQETLYRDYMFTNFANAGMCKLKEDIIDKYGTTLNEYEGTDLANKTYKYLNEVVGVAASTLDSVIDILKR